MRRMKRKWCALLDEDTVPCVEVRCCYVGVLTRWMIVVVGIVNQCFDRSANAKTTRIEIVLNS